MIQLQQAPPSLYPKDSRHYSAGKPEHVCWLPCAPTAEMQNQPR